MAKIQHVVFDFDGTCTEIPKIYQAYSNAYRDNFSTSVISVTPEDWTSAEEMVKAHSPKGGWMVGGTPCAPMAADPYMLSDEVSKLICRQKKVTALPPGGLFSQAYNNNQAPWREDAREVLVALHDKGIRIHFVSNSSSQTIANRLDDLLVGECAVRNNISVASGAGKFLIQELPWDDQTISADMKQRFESLPSSTSGLTPLPFSRPIYLRRGSYFQALCRTLENQVDALASTLICGDVWELDLAMPAQLGMRVHLIHREAPFDTYPYEIEAVDRLADLGSHSVQLKGILELF
jgi:hypothetical protein